MSDIKEEAVSFVGKWIQETDPARKLFDVLTVSLAIFIVGAMWIAYTRQDTVLSMLSDSLQKYPTIDTKILVEGFDDSWKKAQSFGAVAIQCDGVDLADNTRVTLKLAKTSDCPDIGEEGNVRPFIATHETDEQLRALSDVISGDYAIATRGVAPLQGLYIPLPDRVGRLLTGIVVISFPPGSSRDTMRGCRTALEWTDQLAR